MNPFEQEKLLQGIDTFKALSEVWDDIVNCSPNDRQDSKESAYKKGDIVTLTFSNDEFIIEDVASTHQSHLYLLARIIHRTEKIISTESIIKG